MSKLVLYFLLQNINETDMKRYSYLLKQIVSHAKTLLFHICVLHLNVAMINYIHMLYRKSEELFNIILERITKCF